MYEVYNVNNDYSENLVKVFQTKDEAQHYVEDMKNFFYELCFTIKFKEPMTNFVVTHNTKINDDFHTTNVVCSFANRDDAINYVTDMNCESKAEGNYNWYQFVETEVH